MIQFSHIITAPDGIHARPAGTLVKIAKGFSSHITAEINGKSADVKKLFALMGLGAKKGMEITISVEGPDEINAATQLEQCFKDNL